MTIVVNQHLLTNEYPVRILMYPEPEQCVHCTELKSVLTGKARIFCIASLHVTKPWYIISLRNQNEHQSSGSMRIHHHQKNFEQLRLQVK